MLLHAFLAGRRRPRRARRGAARGHQGAACGASPAAVFIDASGDADLCHFAGFGYELAGELEPAQTLTTTFRMVNVDMDRRRTLPKAELHALMAEAAASGAYDLPRREGSDHVTPVAGVTATVMTRLDRPRRARRPAVNATDPDS